MQLNNPLALLSLLLLIPLIIFYLYSRKPKKQIFSSIMFFIRENQMKRRSSFFRKLMANLLFILQLLAILLIGFAAASPIINLSSEKDESHVLIVLDTSASMQTSYGSATRFNEAISRAKSLVRDKDMVSIILAEDIPLQMLEKGSSEKATEILNALGPADSTSNIRDALFQALSIMNHGTVYVLSDFASDEDLNMASQQLNAKGIDVNNIVINDPKDNVGIIDIMVSDDVRLKIKNYNDHGVKINVKHNLTGQSKQLTLAERSVESIYLDLIPGKNVIYIDAKDSMAADNFAYIFVPEKNKIKTLYITNKDGKDFLRTGLESLGKLDIEVTHLPVVPDNDYQLYVINDIDRTKVLPSTFNEIYEKVKDGSSVIVAMQPDSGQIDYQKLGLLELGALRDQAKVVKNIKNEVTSDIEFSSAQKAFTTIQKDCHRWLITNNNDSLLCLQGINEGKIVYYGFIDDYSSFQNTPDYPLFWSSLVDYLVPLEKDYKSNYMTGTVIPIKFQDVDTPFASFKTDKVIMNRAGFYSFDNTTKAANLLNFEESNINRVADLSSDSKLLLDSSVSKTSGKDITRWIVFAAILFMLIEIIVVKWRGDL